MYFTLAHNPNPRNYLYQNVQSIPSLPKILEQRTFIEIQEALHFSTPIISEIKVQMYLPWEKCFFQDFHQDINTYTGEKSITLWQTIHEISETESVSYYPSTQLNGPQTHLTLEDEKNGIWQSTLNKNSLSDLDKPLSCSVNAGDLIGLDRLLYHRSPKQEEQKFVRFIILIRIDEQAKENDFDISQYTPYTPLYYNTTVIPKIRSFLQTQNITTWRNND